MAVTNTGIVLRTITGVNESDLFLDGEATSVTTNTGIVERSIVGVHDANFVHPIGDELISNGGFDDASSWVTGSEWSISGGKLVSVSSGAFSGVSQNIGSIIGKSLRLTFDIVDYTSGTFRLPPSHRQDGIDERYGNIGSYSVYYTPTVDIINFQSVVFTGSIDNISVKEVLVNRESTTTNTGIVERSLTGVNESDLWLDSESTSVVNNTGIVERPITGVNESDPMFPDNTISNIVNIAGLISSLLADLEARATTFENREATQNILINLQKC